MTDVFFGDEGCLALNDGLAMNKSLRTLILSNTSCNKKSSAILINTFKLSKTFHVLRWANLKPFAEEEIIAND